MKEQITEQQKAIVNEAVDKINKALPYPKSLHITHGANQATYSMASGIIDESGGGSVHDVDYYIFRAEDLSKLILEAEGSPTKSAKADIEAYRNTDYVDWPYGRVDGSEIHRDNEKVTLHLEFKKREDMNVFVLAENDYDIPPQIKILGHTVLSCLADYREKAKYKYQNMVYSFLGDPIIPNFGNLNDLETPCELVFDNYLTPETSSDGDYSEECRRILYFDKAMVIEALSKIEPGKTTKVTGSGTAIDFLERAGYGYNRNENTVEKNIKNDVVVTLGITYFPAAGEVVFNFESKPANQNNGFCLSRSIKLSKNGILSSDISVYFIGNNK